MAPQLMATNGAPLRPRARVDGARDELLAGAALAGDEHRRLEVGDLARSSGRCPASRWLLARIDSNWFSFWICSLSARFSRRRVSRSSALRSARTISSGLKGLLT